MLQTVFHFLVHPSWGQTFGRIASATSAAICQLTLFKSMPKESDLFGKSSWDTAVLGDSWLTLVICLLDVEAPSAFHANDRRYHNHSH